MAAEAFGSATLRRVEWLTLALGGLGTALGGVALGLARRRWAWLWARCCRGSISGG